MKRRMRLARLASGATVFLVSIATWGAEPEAPVAPLPKPPVRQVSVPEPVIPGVSIARAATYPARYGVQADLVSYPQKDPQGAIRSVIHAVGCGDVDYMLAQLIAPEQVDERLKGDGREFRKLAAKATAAKSEKMIAALARHLSDGTWLIRRNMAWSRTEGLPDLSLEKVGDRWYMHNTTVPLPVKR